MRLKFIGTNCSLGLQHGQRYNMELHTMGDSLVATIYTSWISAVVCPYSSLKEFANNWSL